jgi:hypothetical protein
MELLRSLTMAAASSPRGAEEEPDAETIDRPETGLYTPQPMPRSMGSSAERPQPQSVPADMLRSRLTKLNTKANNSPAAPSRRTSIESSSQLKRQDAMLPTLETEWLNVSPCTPFQCAPQPTPTHMSCLGGCTD